MYVEIPRRRVATPARYCVETSSISYGCVWMSPWISYMLVSVIGESRFCHSFSIQRRNPYQIHHTCAKLSVRAKWADWVATTRGPARPLGAQLERGRRRSQEKQYKRFGFICIYSGKIWTIIGTGQPERRGAYMSNNVVKRSTTNGRVYIPDKPNVVKAKHYRPCYYHNNNKFHDFIQETYCSLNISEPKEMRLKLGVSPKLRNAYPSSSCSGNTTTILWLRNVRLSAPPWYIPVCTTTTTAATVTVVRL